MTSWRRAILLGLLVWLIPFVVAFVVFPFKQSWRSLFESIMAVTLCVVVVTMGLKYLRRVPAGGVREGALLGSLWFAMSVVIDLPLMLSPPIRMPLAEYAADIGLTYLMIPAITIGLGAARASVGRS